MTPKPRRPSAAMIVAGVALILSLTGGAYAANMLPFNSVGTAQLQNGAVTQGKLHVHSLLASDFAPGQIARFDRFGHGRGPQGPPGKTGATGPTGPAGPPGPQGQTGATGPAGAQATAGPPGSQGPTGPAGPRGSQGPTGQTGPPGSQGATGQTGPMGSPGQAGTTGQTGATGPTGPQGAPGLSGVTVVTVTHMIPNSAVVADAIPCPSGDVATGGGGNIGAGGGAGLVIQQSVPLGPSGPATNGQTPTGWQITVVNTSGASQPFSNYAVCAKASS
jgi:Collagen triple helix repeat (20 copies)